MCNEKFWEPEFLKKKERNSISAAKENKSETSQHNYRTPLIISGLLGNISATEYIMRMQLSEQNYFLKIKLEVL